MAVSTEEFLKEVLLLNCDFNHQLSDLTENYVALIDNSTVCSFMECDSISCFMKFFSEKVCEPIQKLYKSLEKLDNGDYLSERVSTNSSKIESRDKPDRTYKTTAQRRGNLRVFQILKNLLKKPHEKRKHYILKYLRNKIWKCLNSFVISKINRELSIHKIELLSKGFKIFSREQIRLFNSFETTFKQIVIHFPDKPSVLDRILSVDISTLHDFLNSSLRSIYKEFENSYKYKKELKLLKARFRTINLRFLSEILKDFALE